MDLTVKFSKFQLIPIERLVGADWNYKEDDEEKSRALAANLKRNGQIENIIVRELDTGAFEVVNGNHRYRAMQQLGADKVIACNLGVISLAEAQRIAIETNETRFPTDHLKLSGLMKELAASTSLAELAETMPFSLRELELMAGIGEFDWKTYDGGEPGHGAGAGVGGGEDEPFVELSYRVPKDVAALFEEELGRIKKAIGKETGNAFIDDIRALECLALLVREMSDAMLVQEISGGG